MYVIFDMDGVISDSEAVYLAGYLHAARLYDLPEELMRTAVGRATGVTDEMERRIMEDTFGHLPQFRMDRTYRACREYFAEVVESGQMDLKPGAAQILRYLKDREIPVGLASSSPRAMIEKVLGRHGVLQYFDAIVSALSKYSEIYVIEDSYNGIRAAYAAGMNPVMVPDQLPPTEEMRGKTAAILPSLTDVIEWFEIR